MSTEPGKIIELAPGETPPAQSLTVIERARTKLGVVEYRQQLKVLAEKHKSITAITNVDGYKQCHAARMELKTVRITIDKVGKDAREDATAFSRAIISEVGGLIGMIQPEEERLNRLQEEWDAKVEKERLAKVEAERRRVESLRDRMDDIRTRPHGAMGSTSIELESAIVDLVALEIGPEFAEFETQANVARTEALVKLRAMQAQALQREETAAREQRQREEEAARLAAERIELERLRAEQAERDRIERERLAKERAELEAAQAAARAAQVEAAAKQAAEAEAREVEQRRTDAERAAKIEAERLAEEAARKARMAQEATERQERDRISAEQAEAARKAQEAEEDRIRLERAALIRQQAEQNRIALAREIESATLIEAATEAHALLLTLEPGHIATLKLGAALDRERPSVATECADPAPARARAPRTARVTPAQEKAA